MNQYRFVPCNTVGVNLTSYQCLGLEHLQKCFFMEMLCYGKECCSLSTPFEGQCDIFIPKVCLHSSMWTLVANLKSGVMT